MKKKLGNIAMLGTLVLVVMVSCLLMACSSSNHTPAVGDTYVFDSIEIEWGETEYPEWQKTGVEAYVNEMFKGCKLVFISDSTVRFIANDEFDSRITDKTYSIGDGKVVMVRDDNEEPEIYTIKGDTLSTSIENLSNEDIDLVKVTLTVKLSK